ncbi:MAG TPA: L-threonylcarbamoyladenylate synthase [Chitinophagales bacterium]|nr:L-threonylcarbamoyladenylate synthase [Chitinophagales bacterium]
MLIDAFLFPYFCPTMSKIGKDILLARQLLIKGELVAIPTETVYGLAANGLNADAVLKIYEAKNRPSFNPLILHAANIQKAKELVSDFPQKALQLAEKFWPGPLTLVLRKKNSVPDIVTAGLDTVGVRVPNHPLTLELLASLDFPLAAPSANPSGYVSPTLPQHVAEQLGARVAYILDGGKCAVGIESTILKVEDDVITVLRLGGIELEKIQEITGIPLRHQFHTPDKPESPGMLASHYAPGKKLVLGDIEENLRNCTGMKIGVLVFSKSRKDKLPAGAQELILSSAGDLHEAARNLFSHLRQLDDSDAEVILAEPVPDEGLGRAINDRLRRAATK